MLQVLLLTPLTYLFFALPILDQFLKKDEIESQAAPISALYTPYLANERTPGMTFKLKQVTDQNELGIKSLRYDLALGDSFTIHQKSFLGLFKIDWTLGAGMFHEFDVYNSLDNIGWDGVILNQIGINILENYSIKLGVNHISGHIGDEYLLDHPRDRIHYTRNEYAFGLSYTSNDQLRFYTEFGYDFHNNQGGKYLTGNYGPKRFQFGIEKFWNQSKDGYQLFSAYDHEFFEDESYKSSISLLNGIEWQTKKFSKPRLAFKVYLGRMALREFFFERETSYSLGLYLDI